MKKEKKQKYHGHAIIQVLLAKVDFAIKIEFSDKGGHPHD